MKVTKTHLSAKTLVKLDNLITIDKFTLELEPDTLVSNLTDAYSSIIRCGLQELDFNITWEEFHYMLACIIEIDFISYDFNYVASAFIIGLINFESDDPVFEMLDINLDELVYKLQNVHPISCFALVSLLLTCWSIEGDLNNQRTYVEKQLRLKA